MAHDDWELGTGIWVALAMLRWEDWTAQEFVEIGSADATVCDFQSDFVGRALAMQM